MPTVRRSDLPLTLLRTFVARASAALGAVLLVAVVGRLYGPAGVGAIALAQSLLLGAGILAKHGMDHTLMRFVGRAPASPYALRYLAWASKKGLIISLLAAALLWLLRPLLDDGFGTPGLADITTGIALAVPAFTWSVILAGFFKAIGKPATACLLENGCIALIAAVLLLAWPGGHDPMAFSDIGRAYALAAWLVVVFGGAQLLRWAYRQIWWPPWVQSTTAPGNGNGIATDIATDRGIDFPHFSRTSKAFFVQSLAGFMQQVLSVMIAGWLLSATDLGLFKASQHLGLLIAFILVVLNAIFPPRFAALHHQGNRGELDKLARQGALIGVVLAGPLLTVCLIAPTWPLSWFGDDFETAAPLLRIIALAQLVNVATGSVGFLLSMTGHERLIRNIALISNGLGVLALIGLIQLWGVLGAALALAFVLVSQNVAALVFVWKRLGIWTLPTPNVLMWLGVESEAANSAPHSAKPH